jgi:hypothetical protein
VIEISEDIDELGKIYFFLIAYFNHYKKSAKLRRFLKPLAAVFNCCKPYRDGFRNDADPGVGIT